MQNDSERIDLQQSSSDTRRFTARHLVLALLLAAVTAGVLAWHHSPALMADEVSERLTERLDLEVEMTALDVGSKTVELQDVQVSSPEGDARLTIDRLVLVGEILTLARREAESVEEVRIDGARLVLDADHPAFRERFGALKAALTAGDEAEAEEDGVQDETTGAMAALGLDRLLAYLADDAVVQVSNGRVDVRSRGRSVPALDVETARLERQAASSFDFSGHATHGDGSLDWAVEASLAERRVEGDVAWRELPLAALAPYLPERLPLQDLDALHTGGDGRLSGDAGGRLVFTGGADVHGLTVQHDRLAEQPLEDVGARFDGELELDWPTSRLAVRSGQVTHRGVSVDLEATAGLAESPPDTQADGADPEWFLTLDAALPATPCQSMIDAIPAALLRSLSETAMSGTIEGTLALAVHTAHPEKTELEVDLADGCDFEAAPAFGPPDRLRQPFEQATLGHDGEVVHTFETGPGSELWTPIEEVSPFLLQAILAHEDAGFFDHQGFAVYAMESAIERNLERGRPAFGASTLSMQLAKNLFLTRDKTVARKAREAVATWWLEHHFDKREILELYVNVVEFGPEIFGIEQAADHYFGRRPLDLTPAESVFLSTLLPAPVPRSAQRDEGLWTSTENEIAFLLRHMLRKGRIDPVALDHGLAQLESFRFRSDDAPRTTADFSVDEDGHAMIDPVGVAVDPDYGLPGALPFETLYRRHRPAEVFTISQRGDSGEIVVDEGWPAGSF